MGSLRQSLWLELARPAGQSRLVVSFFCDGKSLDQVPAQTHLAFLNGGLILFIFQDCSNGCSAPAAGERGSEEVAETFRVRHLPGEVKQTELMHFRFRLGVGEFKVSEFLDFKFQSGRGEKSLEIITSQQNKIYLTASCLFCFMNHTFYQKREN